MDYPYNCAAILRSGGQDKITEILRENISSGINQEPLWAH